jgi:hypothetical protein
MAYTIACYTLFDVTNTGFVSRQRPTNAVDMHRRNTQNNFDTIIQAISLRSQPENITVPEKSQIRFDEFQEFGFFFTQQENEVYNCWSFDFEIQHKSVYDNGISELGALYSDCDRVPIILCGTEWEKLPSFLDTSNELRNIYFKIKSYD